MRRKSIFNLISSPLALQYTTTVYIQSNSDSQELKSSLSSISQLNEVVVGFANGPVLANSIVTLLSVSTTGPSLMTWTSHRSLSEERDDHKFIALFYLLVWVHEVESWFTKDKGVHLV